MKVDIYITTEFRGDFKCGEGAYGIVLSTMLRGKEETKEHYAGWKDISRQKLSVKAAVEALEYVNMPCDVAIRTDSPYVKYVAESGNTNGNFPALWLTFFAARNRMKSVTVEVETRHKYQSLLEKGLEKGNYTVIRDR